MYGIPPIKNLDQLIDILHSGPGYDGYTELMRSIAFDAEELMPYATWKKGHYTRNCLSADESHQLILMCWEVGQNTPIHNYGNGQGWLLVVDGVLTEEVYTRSAVDNSAAMVYENKLKPGNVSYINDYNGFHRFINKGPGRAMSLHLYDNESGPWEVYRPGSRELEIMTLGYDTHHAHKFR